MPKQRRPHINRAIVCRSYNAPPPDTVPHRCSDFSRLNFGEHALRRCSFLAQRDAAAFAALAAHRLPASELDVPAVSRIVCEVCSQAATHH